MHKSKLHPRRPLRKRPTTRRQDGPHTSLKALSWYATAERGKVRAPLVDIKRVQAHRARVA